MRITSTRGLLGPVVVAARCIYAGKFQLKREAGIRLTSSGRAPYDSYDPRPPGDLRCSFASLRARGT